MTTGKGRCRRHCGSKNRPWNVEPAKARALGSRTADRLAKAWLRSTPPEKARALLAARAAAGAVRLSWWGGGVFCGGAASRRRGGPWPPAAAPAAAAPTVAAVPGAGDGRPTLLRGLG